MGKIKYYITGAYNIVVSTLPYKLYFSRFHFLLPKHYKEQYSYRINSSMPCVVNRSCLECGCNTPQLMFAPKQCDKKCYPKLMNRLSWFIYKINNYKKVPQNINRKATIELLN